MLLEITPKNSRYSWYSHQFIYISIYLYNIYIYVLLHYYIISSVYLYIYLSLYIYVYYINICNNFQPQNATAQGWSAARYPAERRWLVSHSFDPPRLYAKLRGEPAKEFFGETVVQFFEDQWLYVYIYNDIYLMIVYLYIPGTQLWPL